LAGQGTTINSIADTLESNGWNVIFVCVPNTPHIGVVPIPIEGGSSNQRYPDVLAVKGDVLRLTEVEVKISDDVVNKTIERFAEQQTSLRDVQTWQSWSARIQSLTGIELPAACQLYCELVVCNDLRPNNNAHVSRVTAAGIRVFDTQNYEP